MLTLRFKENNFTKIELKDPVQNTTLSGEKKFGIDQGIKTAESGYFKIQLKYNEGKVQAGLLDNGEPIQCPDNSIIIVLDEVPILIRYKNGTEQVYKDYVSGYIYYDAMALVSDKIGPRTKLEIMKSYGYEGSDQNLFLKSIYDSSSEKNKQQVSVVGSSFLTSLGNTDVTYFAAGLARFLAERTKEELNEAFFSRMKEKLNAYPELETVFPQTTLMLNAIETYSYASVIQVLKEAFETDIQNLPENLYNLKVLSDCDCNEFLICGNDEDCKDYLNCQVRLKNLVKFFDTQEGHWAALGMYTVKEASQSSNPEELLNSITKADDFVSLKKSSFYNSKFVDYNILSSIELSNLISQSLVSKDEKQVWITPRQLDSLLTFKEGEAFMVYLGLLLSFEQRPQDDKLRQEIKFYKSSNPIDTITFGQILIRVHLNISEYGTQIKSLIKNTYSAYNSANNAVKKMITASENNVEVEPQVLYNYYRTFTSSIKPIVHNELLSSIVGKDFSAAYNNVEQFLNPSVDIAYHISTKKYSAAVYDASILLNVLNEYKIIEKNKKGIDTAKTYDGFKPVTKSFVKYGTLISTVANAQSSDEVKQALDASVLPAGSSSIKRKSAWSISVNGYVGGFYGCAHSKFQDTLRNTTTSQLDTIIKENSYRTFGLYAPIGLSFNRGFKCGWGITINAQIIDLGALVNFYLTEGDEASIPTDFKVKLSDILSPGIQLGINLPKTPLTIMGGVQYIPALNSTLQISNSQLSPLAWRAQVSILVDIPLYNLKVWDFKK